MKTLFGGRNFARCREFCLVLAIGTAIAAAFPAVGRAETYKEIPVTDGGTIEGRIAFKGTVPDDAVERILITKDQDVCGKGYREVVWVDAKGGALRGAFAFIDRIEEGKKWTRPKGGRYLIVQKGCRFRPWAQVVRPGPIVIRNSDRGVRHNINATELYGVERGRVARRTLFNLGQSDPGDIDQRVKPRRSPYIAVNCEAHNFMFGFMLTPNHPYAVVVNEDGSFSFDDVPPGTYTLKAWHPVLGVKSVEVTVAAKGRVETTVVFTR